MTKPPSIKIQKPAAETDSAINKEEIKGVYSIPKLGQENAAGRPLGHSKNTIKPAKPEEQAAEYIKGIHSKSWNGEIAYSRFYLMPRESYKHLRNIDINRTLALVRGAGNNTHTGRKRTLSSNILLQMTNVYEAGIRAGIAPDRYTYQELIAINTDLMNFDRAYRLIEEMIQRGIKPTIRPYRTLLNGYSALVSEIDNARRLWQSMLAKIGRDEIAADESSDQPAKLDLATYTCIVAAECNVGNLARVTEILEEMSGAGIVADIVLRNTILGGILKHGGLDSGIKEVKFMVDSGYIPNSYTYYLLIQSAVSEERIGVVKRLLIESVKRGVTPSVKMIRKLPLLPAEILDIVTENGVEIDMIRVYNPLIGLAMRENSFNEALGLIARMRAQSIEPNTVTYSHLLDALSKANRLNEAKLIYKEAFGEGGKLVPDTHILGIMIDTCARADDIRGIFWYKMEMERRGLAPTEVIYNIILTALSRRKQMDLGAIMLTMNELMETNPPIRPSTRTLNVVYTAFQTKAEQSGKLTHAELDFLRKWYSKTSSDIDLYVPRDMFTYAFIISAFANAGLLEDALFVYSDMLKHAENDSSVRAHFTRSPKYMAKLILVCAKNQQYTKILDLWRDWRWLGIPGHEGSLRIVLFACDQVGQSTTARDIVFGLLVPPELRAVPGDPDSSIEDSAEKTHMRVIGSNGSLPINLEDSPFIHDYQPAIVSGSVLALFVGIAIKHGMIEYIMPALNLLRQNKPKTSRPILSLAGGDDEGDSHASKLGVNTRFSSDNAAKILALLQESKHESSKEIINDFLTFIEDNFPEAAPV
ncbi:hypothetical protein EV177_002963 [Coemansia sp. RSA 1804]|nr:hypothetical protein EV177_002963 [Coemansia sp. RSA 1804]